MWEGGMRTVRGMWESGLVEVGIKQKRGIVLTILSPRSCRTAARES